MRTLIDIPDKQIKDLMAICEAEKVSHAEHSVFGRAKCRRPDVSETDEVRMIGAVFDTNILIDYLNG